MKIIRFIRNGFELDIKTLQEPISEVADHPFLVGPADGGIKPVKKGKISDFLFF